MKRYDGANNTPSFCMKIYELLTKISNWIILLQFTMDKSALHQKHFS